MTLVPFVDLAAQYRSIETEVSTAIENVLSSCSYILGSQLDEFEQAFAEFTNTAHAVGVSSGLDALRMALWALDIGSEDEVIIPANTYIATALAVSDVGAKPVLVDCDPLSYNIDVSLIKSSITSRTRAIIPVHLTGQAADLDPILEIADEHGLHVIEDAAQAHGTLYKGQLCGSMGVMGCFSFYPGKNLGAYGDAGMVTTNNADLAARLRRIRNYGQRAKYEHVEKGVNARLDTLQAAILNVKLRHLPAWNEARVNNSEKYRKLLSGTGDLTLPQTMSYSTHVYHLFMIETDKRDDLQKHLGAADIQTGIHYPRPIHLQEAYSELGHQRGDFPKAERLSSRVLSLPMYSELTDQQIGRVVHEVQRFFNAN